MQNRPVAEKAATKAATQTDKIQKNEDFRKILGNKIACKTKKLRVHFLSKGKTSDQKLTLYQPMLPSYRNYFPV